MRQRARAEARAISRARVRGMTYLLAAIFRGGQPLARANLSHFSFSSAAMEIEG